MKKKKLTLENINVQSFVTTLDNENKKAVVGGGDTNYGQCGHTCGGFLGDGRHFPYCQCPDPTTAIC